MEKVSTAKRLKEIMELKNLKQVDILRRAEYYCEEHGIKLNKSDLSQYVSGTVEPGQEKLSILGMALNVSEVWLLGYDVPMERHSGETKHNNTIKEGSVYLNPATVEERSGDDQGLSMRLLSYYLGLLNMRGQKEALKRIQELTLIPTYTISQREELNAAHSIEGATQEDKEHDDDIMKNF